MRLRAGLPVAAVHDRRLRSVLALGAGLAFSAAVFAADSAPVSTAPASAPAAAPATPADNAVIYPRGSAGAGSTAERAPSSFGPTTAIAILMLAGGGGWLVWRSRRDGGLGMVRSEKKLAIAETKSLGNRQYLVVATYEDKKFLLGVCPGRIDLLTPLDGSKSAKDA